MDLHPPGNTPDDMKQKKVNSPRLTRKMTKSIPYGEGIQTQAQEDAVISGDQAAMQAAGVPPIAQFNRDLLQLVHDWQVQSVWEGGKGQQLVDSPYKKRANDNFFAGIAKLAEKYKDYPEVQQRIQEEYTPARTRINEQGQKVTEGSTTWQRTQEDFDALRINAEFMKLLDVVGQQVSGAPFTSFSQLSTVKPSIIDKALDQIVAKETHFGGGIAWLPTKIGPQWKGRMHQFDSASFKAYLKKSLDSMISGAVGGDSPKNVAWWQHGQPTDTEGITPVVRRQTPGDNSTQMGQDEEDTGLVQTMSYYQDEDEETPHKVRRFKVVVR
jgi:hypothetical protein